MVQSRETINALRSKYPPDHLFMVKGRCDIKEPLDLAANSGLIVAVIKKEDPMGNTSRWFVDAGRGIFCLILLVSFLIFDQFNQMLETV